MILPQARTSSHRSVLACMAGHREGYRQLNGGVGGMSSLEKDFRYRMHELCGLARETENVSENTRLFQSGLRDLWRSIYGLHEFFGKSNRVDDLIHLLIITRKAWLREPLDAARLKALRECLNRMATEPHTVEGMLILGRELEAAGVDLKSGF
ncbi:MAG: hypothetical protein V4726_08250 [Verrucomicrobiota bacterium]